MILAIESTCDETGAAVVAAKKGGVEILSNEVASSAEIHVKYGGVVPEVAAREQIRTIIPVVKEAMEKAGVSKEEIEAIAVAYGPGLIGSLLIGVESAKALALAWDKPLIAVNHMAAHVMANWIKGERNEVPARPAVGLVVSGGHTDIILLKSLEKWEWIGGTRDDAAGECLDKCARVLGLPYPGGPEIEKAAEGASGDLGYRLPRPLIHEDNLEMSFSGLKEAVVREVTQKKELEDWERQALCKELLEALTEVLVEKTMMAVDKWQPKSVLLAGGVAASKRLRERLGQRCEEAGVRLFMPEFRYCTDNAAMVGAAAVLRPIKKNALEVRPEPSLEVV